MDGYNDNIQARREAAAGTRTGGSRGATGISFNNKPLSPVKAAQQPGAVGIGGPVAGGGPQPSGAFAPQPSGAFAPQPSGAFAPQPSGSFAPQPAFGAPQASGSFAPTGFGSFQPSGTFGAFRPGGAGGFGAPAGPTSVGGATGSTAKVTPPGSAETGKERKLKGTEISMGPAGPAYSPTEGESDIPTLGEGGERHVTMGSAGQHHRTTTTSTKMSQQMQAFGIAQMVSSADDNIGGGPRTQNEKRGGGGGEVAESAQDLLKMIPRRGLFQCYVMRDKSSFKTMMNPKYALFATRSSKFLLAGRKRANKQTSNYLVSLDQEDLERASQNFHGKVRSNLAGTEFIVYDKGCKPGEEREEGPFLREELAAILYETNIGGTSGPRKIKMIIPALKADDTHKKWIPRTEEEGIIAEYRRNPDSNEFVVLTNKDPTWNEQLRSYQLNFHGRVTKPSVKNFQLCDVKQPNRVVFQFGKVDENKFNLDFQYPLSAYQALCLALTSFDNKLACK